MKPLSDVTAIAIERAGRLPMTEAAFVTFHARTAEPVKGYLRRLTGDAALAEDLMQDAYIRFLASGRIPEDDDHRRNYLYRIATNLARDHFRAEGRRRPLTHEAQSPLAASNAESTRDVWRLLAQVSPRDRELLVLAYVEGMTHREIAAVTGLMPMSVKPLLFRARQRFAGIVAAAGLRLEQGRA